MGYKMKHGNSAVPFKQLGSSPMKNEKDLPEGFKSIGYKESTNKRTLTNKMTNKDGGYLRQIRTDMNTGDSDTTYVKPKTITKEQFGMSDKRYNKLQKNREYQEYATKTGIIPDFNAIKNDSTRTAEIVKFYGNKSNVNMLNKGQNEYFKKTGGWDGKER